MKKLSIIFFVLILLIFSVVPCLGVNFENNYNNYIELANYYILVPDQSVEYIHFTDDGYMYFNSTGTVTCVLVHKNGDLWASLSFSTIYFNNTISNIYSEALTIQDYYSNRVSYRFPNNNTPQHIQPIKKSDIISSDIVPRHSPNFWTQLIAIILMCKCVIDVFYIVSKRRDNI